MSAVSTFFPSKSVERRFRHIYGSKTADQLTQRLEHLLSLTTLSPQERGEIEVIREELSERFFS